jgi:energy-coupling factor transporter transmembrane protein EcfT
MGKIQQWKETAQQLPGMVMIQLHKADDVADAMRMRGYGNQIPRGVAGPIPFSLIHFIIMIAISLSFILIQSIAQI